MNPSNNNNLNTPVAMFEKCVREARRSYLSKEHFQSVDSFYNFAITAHSLRDWLIKMGIDKSLVHDKFNSYDLLVYCKDIANGIKHFGLDNKKVSSVVSVESFETTLAAITIDNEKFPNADAKFINTSFVLDNNVEITPFNFFFKSLSALNEIFIHFNIPVSNNCNPALFCTEKI